MLTQAMDTTDPEKQGPKAANVDGTTMLQLLKDCSGIFRPGILTALVGSSGAGKTTLMDVLAGRKTGVRSACSRRWAGRGGGVVLVSSMQHKPWKCSPRPGVVDTCVLMPSKQQGVHLLVEGRHWQT